MAYTTFTPKGKDDWLAFRRDRVTATEVGKLFTTKTRGCWEHLGREKTTGVATFHGNKYTDWGKNREGLLATWATLEYPTLVHNSGNTIWLDDATPWLCATPDMTGPVLEDGAIELGCEIKTTAKPFTGGRFHHVVPDNYFLQVQVNLMCTGAKRWLFVWEEHEQFRPRPPQCLEVRPDLPVQQQIMDVVAEFHRFHVEHTNPDWFADDVGDEEQLWRLVEDYRVQRAQLEQAKTMVEATGEQIRQLVGAGFSGQRGGIKVSTSQPKPSRRFDTTTFKKDHADLYQQYQVEGTTPAPRLTITEVKQ